jgi:1-acyl-sn-glycerol-3-phosphate acyltransferase
MPRALWGVEPAGVAGECRIEEMTPQKTSAPIQYFRFARLLLHLLSGLAMVRLAFPFISHVAQQKKIRRWAAKLLAILNVRVSIEGAPPPDWGAGCVLASNHISWLDIFVIQSVCPARFVAKSEIRDWPLIGWLCANTGTLFIERGRRHHTAKINAVMLAALAAGDPVGLFPEATTTRGDTLKKFHSSLFEAAVTSAAPLYPITLRYRDRAGNHTEAAVYVDDMSLLDSINAIVREPELVERLSVAPAIIAKGMRRRELAGAAEIAIASRLGLSAPHKTPETVPDLAAALP